MSRYSLENLWNFSDPEIYRILQYFNNSVTNRINAVVYAMLPGIFQCYIDHNYKFFFVDDEFNPGQERLIYCLVEELFDHQRDFKITHYIGQFIDIPEIHYKDFIEPF